MKIYLNLNIQLTIFWAPCHVLGCCNCKFGQEFYHGLVLKLHLSIYLSIDPSIHQSIHPSIGERGGSVVECRTPEREVRGSRPTSAVLCPWARHFTPRKYWLITQEAMAPSRHDWKIVDWDVKPQHNQPTIHPLHLNIHGGHRPAVLRWRKARVDLDNSVGKYSVKPPRPGRWQLAIHTYRQVYFICFVLSPVRLEPAVAEVCS